MHVGWVEWKISLPRDFHIEQADRLRRFDPENLEDSFRFPLELRINALLDSAGCHYEYNCSSLRRGYAFSMKSAFVVYQIKIALKNIQPPIWRRILIPAHVTFHVLHEAIQNAMGWGGGHLHDFDFRRPAGFPGRCITDTQVPDVEPFDDAEEERKLKLSDVFRGAGHRCVYTYDFGDSWEHDVLLEKVLDPVPGMEYPVCIKGKRQCPPEDCGGPWGYEELLAILSDPKHKEHADMLEWLSIESPEDFDPEEFDADIVNEMLRDASPSLILSS